MCEAVEKKSNTTFFQAGSQTAWLVMTRERLWARTKKLKFYDAFGPEICITRSRLLCLFQSVWKHHEACPKSDTGARKKKQSKE